MEVKIKGNSSTFWFYFRQFLCLIPIAITLHYIQITFINQRNFRYIEQTNLDVPEASETPCKQLMYEMSYMRREMYRMRNELEEIWSWKSDINPNFEDKLVATFDKFYSDHIGIFDYASEYAGGFIISTPNTMSYPSKFGLRLFGAFDWTLYSEPSLLLQHATFPGKCYAFYGNKGRIRIGLGRPILVTHVSLEHIRLGESQSSAPKDFQVLGLRDDGEENLGYFVYDLEDSIIQTFRVTSKNHTFRSVELRILSNYGNEELTCVYRFRVHSLNLNSN